MYVCMFICMYVLVKRFLFAVRHLKTQEKANLMLNTNVHKIPTDNIKRK